MKENEPIDADWLKKEIKADRWILAGVGACFRKELARAFAPQFSPEDLETTPTCFLAAAFYRGETNVLSARARGIRIDDRDLEVIEAQVEANHEFWSNAVTALVGGEGRLAKTSAQELTLVSQAIDEVVSALPEIEQSLGFVQQFVFYEGSNWAASSQPHYAGSIFLKSSLIGTPSLTETIVHEVAHQELFCLNLLDRLVTPEADEKFVYAPFQRTERPTIGRLHAAHSLYRTVQYLAAVNSPKLGRSIEQLEKTLLTFASGDLTEVGELLLRRYENCIQTFNNKPNRRIAG